MIITYDVSCFERELKVVFPDGCKVNKKKIVQILDDAYYFWHHPEDIEDEEERECAEDACCEEYMMDELSLEFNQWEKWTSIYYGDDEEEMEEEVYWIENTLKGDVVNE